MAVVQALRGVERKNAQKRTRILPMTVKVKMIKDHPQGVAHPATAEMAESDPKTELFS